MAIVGNKKLPFPVGTDPQSVRQRVEAMERVLERLFVIPGTKQSVGLDVVLDLVPIVGDIAAAGLGAYIVWEAKNLGMSKGQIARMASASSACSALGPAGPGLKCGNRSRNSPPNSLVRAPASSA